MAQTYNRIKAIIQTVADLATQPMWKILLGTPGTKIPYPQDSIEGRTLYSTGQLWGSGDAGIDHPYPFAEVLEGVGTALDANVSNWATIQTNGVGVAPTILGGWGFTSVSKNEVTDQLTLNFTSNYTNAYYFASAKHISGGPGGLIFDRINTRNIGSLVCSFTDSTPTTIDINNNVVELFTCGSV